MARRLPSPPRKSRHFFPRQRQRKKDYIRSQQKQVYQRVRRDEHFTDFHLPFVSATFARIRCVGITSASVSSGHTAAHAQDRLVPKADVGRLLKSKEPRSINPGALNQPLVQFHPGGRY